MSSLGALIFVREHQGPGWELAISSEDFASYYVARKLTKHGFVRANSLPGDADDEWITIEEMTATGHEFLETIRDPKAWKATKAGARRVGNFSLGVLAAVAKSFTQAKIKQYTGLDVGA